jgi:Fe-S-cluster containining protein
MTDERKPENVLHVNDQFQFSCGPEVPCFTKCCRDVTIFLTPYDVIRMKNRLGIRSGEFLEKYVRALKAGGGVVPLLVLRMGDDADKLCPLVSEETGCRVYEDRPWSCRMFPLDQCGPVSYRVIAEAGLCKGFEQPHRYQVSDYLVDQGVLVYKEMERLFEEITGHPGLKELDVDNEKIGRMIYMALYDLDHFRDFLFETSFFERFDVDETTRNLIRENDIELLKFGVRWIRFGLFGDPYFNLRPGVTPPEGFPAEGEDQP